MMEAADLLLRAGGIGVIAYVVTVFCKVLREVSSQCHANQDRSTTAVIANTAALAEVTEASRAGAATMNEVKTLLIRAEAKHRPTA